MNWRNRILIGFSVFVVGIGTMVYIAMKQTNEMVDDNYYEKELTYQSKIDAAKNLNALQEKVIVENENGFVKIKLPVQSINCQPIGKIEFLRPSQQELDINAVLNVDIKGEQVFNRTKFITGIYQLSIDWTNNGTNYYYNQELNIKP